MPLTVATIFCCFFTARTIHPGSRRPCFTHILNIIWTVRSLYYQDSKQYMDRTDHIWLNIPKDMDRTVHIAQHTRIYRPYGPYLGQHTRRCGPCGTYLGDKLGQHFRSWGSCSPYIGHHFRSLVENLKLKQFVGKSSKHI